MTINSIDTCSAALRNSERERNPLRTHGPFLEIGDELGSQIAQLKNEFVCVCVCVCVLTGWTQFKLKLRSALLAQLLLLLLLLLLTLRSLSRDS